MLRRGTLAALLCLTWAGHASPHGHRARKAETASPDRVEIDCPVAVDGAGVVLARVGSVTITGCDLAIEWRRQRSAGLRVDDPRALLQGLVDDALRAETMTPPPPAHRGQDIHRDPTIDAELAEALIRREALDALAAERPTDDEVQRYYDAHRDEFTSSERARVRQLLFVDRERAVAAIHALRDGARFEDLLPRSVDPLAARDQGDLGYLVRGGTNEGFPPELIEPAWALQQPGDVIEAPVRVTARASTTVMRRGRLHTSVRRVRAWCVLQLVDRAPEVVAPLDVARTRILHRLTRSDYLTERQSARVRWEQQLAPQVGEAIRAPVLDLVQLRPTDAPR